MPELKKPVERTLWFDGPNYTADAVIVDSNAAKILLIQRGDTGEWALPGGFVDETDTSALEAAVREAEEEAGVAIAPHAPLIFRGVVDDPRNSETAWIETSAYLFSVPSTTDIMGGDDAQDAQWHNLTDLPPLYASHRTIVERGLDYLAHKELSAIITAPDTNTSIDAGHMEYAKSFYEKDGIAVFAKQHDPNRFTDSERAARAYDYLAKEAFTMMHLRQHAFPHIPDRSILDGDTFTMDALQEHDGWQWRAEADTLDLYIRDALKAFGSLESSKLPADTFPIDPSYDSLRTEGWHSFDNMTISKLKARLQQFESRLTNASKETAYELLEYISELHHTALQPHEAPHFVFCHHDIRQSNLAWHPDHGTKLIDWSWAGLGEPNSDSTSLLIDLAKSGHDITAYLEHVNPHHCLTLIGFWLAHSTWPEHGDDTVRFQQFVSALSGYEVLKMTREQA